MLTRIRRYRLALLPMFALGLALALGACGGDGGSDDAKKKLDEAFKKPIGSANVTVDAEAAVSGIPLMGNASIKAKLAGPYQSNGDDKLPSLDWDVSVSAVGRTFSGGLAVTADNVFITYQGQAYELGAEQVKEVQGNLKEQADKSKQEDEDLSELGINPANWVTDAKEEDDANVAGVETEHISAKVDVDKLLDDANKLVQKAPEVGAVAGQEVPSELTDEQKDALKQVLQDPTLDVYIGKDDGIIRRVSFDFKLEISEADRQQLRGISGADMSVSVEFKDVGKPVTVTPPTNAKPLDDLVKQLFSSGIPGLPGGIPGVDSGSSGSDSGSGSSDSGESGSSSSGSDSASPPGGTDLGTGGGAAPQNAEKFQEYLECIQGAGSDQDKVAACSRTLR